MPAAPLDPVLERDILAAVDAGFDAQLAFTIELVRHPSTRGREHAVQALVHDALASRDYAVDRWAVDPEEIRHHSGFSPWRSTTPMRSTSSPPTTRRRRKAAP